MSESENIHWIDKLASRIENELRTKNKREYVFNGGLSVSGLQHIGRLRGEILIPEAVRRILEKKGFKIRQLLTLYTQDPWKGKKSQRDQFNNPSEARKYTGWPLFMVPDPKGCHKNWVEHYWSDFGPYLSEFTDGKIEVVTTTDLYKGPFRDFILKIIIPKKDDFRKIINKYRGRKPYPPEWIPVEPICEKCNRIDKTVSLSINNEGIVSYKCKNCGHKGETDISNAKLNWRIEWAGIWYILNVDFEPYGKDHATPGGSRDSCKELAEKVIGFKPPIGEWYEWVALRVNGKTSDMSSSDFTGITPREWLEIAHPQILRFLYFYTDPHRKVVVDLSRIPQYYDQYYKAERIYFGYEEPENKDEEKYLKRTYELSHPHNIPETMPVQIPYTHAAILAQIVGPTRVEEAIRRLKKTGHIKDELDEYSKKWIVELLQKSFNWIQKYAPNQLRFSVIDSLDKNILENIKFKEIFCNLSILLENLSEWGEESIKNAMIEATNNLDSKTRKEFYKEFYLVFVGKPKGPRAAPLLSLLNKEFVIRRLRSVCKRA